MSRPRPLPTNALTLILLFAGLAFAPAFVHGQTAMQIYNVMTPSTASVSYITGGTTASPNGTGTTIDDNVYTNVPIGFTYRFCGADYTTLGISSNGFVWFGAGNPGAINTPLSSAFGSGVISAFGADLRGQSAASSISYVTQGTAPNRTFIIQWKQLVGKTLPYDGVHNTMDMWIYLSEKPCDYNALQIYISAAPYVWNSNLNGQVGIRGTSIADFVNRAVDGTTSLWTTSTWGGSNSSTATISSSCLPGVNSTVNAELFSFKPNLFYFTLSPPNSCNSTLQKFFMTYANGKGPFNLTWTFSGTNSHPYPKNQSATGIFMPYSVSAVFADLGTAALSVVATDANGCSAQLDKSWIMTFCNTSVIFDSVPEGMCICGNYSLRYYTSGAFAAGNTFTAELSDANGSFASPVVIGSVTTSATAKATGFIPVTIPCNTPPGLHYRIRIKATNPVPFAVFDNGFDIELKPFQTADTYEFADKVNICQGDNVKFTQLRTNGGKIPLISWYVNGTKKRSGINDTVYNTTTLKNNDTVWYSMASSTCATNPLDSSNKVIISVSSTAPATINVTLSPGNVICSGASVTFSAHTTNKGPAPSFQWRINGIPISGATDSTYTSSTLTNNNKVDCILNSSNNCAIPSKDTSAQITMTVSTLLDPSVGISYTPNDPLCSATPITFTAAPQDTGITSTVTYQWYQNYPVKIAGATKKTYTPSPNLAAGSHDITVRIKTNFACVSADSALSTQNVMVYQTVSPSVSLTLAPNSTVCEGTTVTFTADTSDGGKGPLYSWKLNGAAQATPAGNANILSTSNFNIGKDSVELTFTSNATCVTTPNTDYSKIYLTVLKKDKPVVTVTSNPAFPTCPGTSVQFTAANTAFGGAPPAYYRWFINDTTTTVKATGTTYTPASLANNDKVICVMKSSLGCVAPNPVMDTVIASFTTPLSPTVTLSASPNSAICTGQCIDFTADTTNAGVNPTIEWYINNVKQATTGKTFHYCSFANSDDVYAKLIVGAGCISPSSLASSHFIVSVSSQIAPKVTITAPTGTICPSQTINFTTTNNVGATATFQWYVDEAPVAGATIANYTPNTTLVTAGPHEFKCVMTAIAACISPSIATDSASITVRANVTPTVSVGATPKITLCPTTQITFKADTTNGGKNPQFAWAMDGGAAIAGATTSTYTRAVPAGTHTFTCTFTSNAACVIGSPVSDDTVITVNASQTASVAIGANVANPVCANQKITFTATPTNGGNAQYQWYAGNFNTPITGATNNILVDSFAANTKVICKLTSDATCLTNPNDTASAAYSVIITSNVNPTVTIQPIVSPICQNQVVTATTTQTGGGAVPTKYEWFIDGQLQLPNTSTFTLPTATAGTKLLKCIMTSSLSCVNKPTAADSVSFTVSANVTATAQASANPASPVCQGAAITFTGVVTNEGTNPVYSWKEGSTVLSTNLSFTTSNLTPAAHTIVFTQTSNAVCVQSSPASATVNITVLPTVTPTITIATTYAGDKICPNTPVDFTSVVTGQGSIPQYQWYDDVTPIPGATGSTYTANLSSAAMHNIKCELTSDAACAVNPATSGTIAVDVVSTLPASVVIVGNKPGPFCPGDVVTFTATPTNGGKVPQYEWNIGATVEPGSTSNTYVYTTDAATTGSFNVFANLTSDLTCATPKPAASNNISITVNPNVQTAVTITADIDTLCAGTPVTLTAHAVNGGTSPRFSWTPGPANSPDSVYVTSSLKNNDVISCTITSNASCVTNSPATSSNSIPVKVNPILVPAVDVAADTNKVCEGTPVTFTATPHNSGSQPAYEWFVNNVSSGNGPTYSSSSLVNNTKVKCYMTADTTCLSTTAPVADSLTVSIVSWVDASIVISVEDTNVCAGDQVIFNSSITNGGAGPGYQWTLNGQVTGTDISLIMDSVNNNDVVRASLHSNAQCVNNPDVVSNVLTMNVTPIPIIFLEHDSFNTCFGTETPLNAFGADSYSWAPEQGLSCYDCSNPVASPENTTVYIVTGTTNGCSAFAPVKMQIGCKYIYAPNTFTPNGDGINDKYRVFGPKINNFKLSIYDRWGAIVFTTNDQTEEWDGKCNGKRLNTGVYLWVVSGDIGGNKLSINGVVTGDVTLIGTDNNISH